MYRNWNAAQKQSRQSSIRAWGGAPLSAFRSLTSGFGSQTGRGRSCSAWWIASKRESFALKIKKWGTSRRNAVMCPLASIDKLEFTVLYPFAISPYNSGFLFLRLPASRFLYVCSISTSNSAKNTPSSFPVSHTSISRGAPVSVS